MAENYVLLLPRTQSSMASSQGRAAHDKEREARSRSKWFDESLEWLEHNRADLEAAPDSESTLSKVGAALLSAESKSIEAIRHDLNGALLVPDFHLQRVESTVDVEPLQATEAQHLETIGVLDARAQARIGRGAGTRVAIFDSGVHGAHSEFEQPVEQYELVGNAIERAQSAHDHHSNSHGTHVASLVAGTNMGVAPGAQIVSLVTLEDDTLRFSDLIVRWIAFLADELDDPVQIASLSLGLSIDQFDPVMVAGLSRAFEELRMLGVLPIVAAGNDGRNSLLHPAGLPKTLAVGASRFDKRIYSYSSSGMLSVSGGQIIHVPDLVAPGVHVCGALSNGSFGLKSGTSQAAPIVAGVAALLLEQAPMSTIEELEDELLGSCQMLSGVAPIRQGAGEVSLWPRN